MGCHPPVQRCWTVYLEVMKESWLLYDYARRWWGLLLIFCVVGAMTGRLLDQSVDNPVAYAATTTVAINAPLWSFEDPPGVSHPYPPPVFATLISSTESNRQLAVADIQTQIRRITAYGHILVTSHGIIVDEIPQGDANWWKAVVLGSVLGGLLAVGCIYVWEDAKEYRRQARQRV